MTPLREITTERLLLRAPRPEDAEAVFARYASDPEVTRYVGFPRHRSVQDAQAFIQLALAEWADGNPMAYLAFSRDDGRLVGGTGISVETPERASTGYVLARDSWGRGLATEMALAMVDAAFDDPRLWRLYAMCHVDHAASERVLAKAGFAREATLRRYMVFPNLETIEPQDVAVWARVREPVARRPGACRPGGTDAK